MSETDGGESTFEVGGWETVVEGGAGGAALTIVVGGRTEHLRYTEKHLLDLQQMILSDE
jgi:hypothetical protein